MTQFDSLTPVLLRALDRVTVVIERMEEAGILTGGAAEYVTESRRCLEAGQLASALDSLSLALLEIGGYSD